MVMDGHSLAAGLPGSSTVVWVANAIAERFIGTLRWASVGDSELVGVPR